MTADEVYKFVRESLHEIGQTQGKTAGEIVLIRECLVRLTTSLQMIEKTQCSRPDFCLELEQRILPLANAHSQAKGAARFATILWMGSCSFGGSVLTLFFQYLLKRL